jgi:hypothetical protein
MTKRKHWLRIFEDRVVREVCARGGEWNRRLQKSATNNCKICQLTTYNILSFNVTQQLKSGPYCLTFDVSR